MAMAMVGHAMDRGGLKDSKNAPNSFFPKINRTVFCDLGTDMAFDKKCNVLESILITKKSLEISFNLTSQIKQLSLTHFYIR